MNHWYRGGNTTHITLGGATVLGGITSAGPGAPIAPGTRLLVASDDKFAWACGYTQPYSAQVATQWNDALTP